MVRQPSPQDGPHGRRQHHAHPEDRHGHALFFWGIGFAQNRLGERNHTAAPEALQDAIAEHLREGLGRPRQHRPQRKEHQGGEVQAFPSQ